MDKIPIELQIAELIRRFGNNPIKCVSKILSITNRVKCEECDNGVINAEEFSNNDVPIMSDCPSCKDGWIYPDPQKMYEALLKLDKWMDASLPHFKLDAKGIIKQAIKGE